MSTKVEIQPYSFDLDSIVVMDAVGYVIRQTIVETALSLIENKQCIPLNVVKQAIIKLDLKQYLDKVDI